MEKENGLEKGWKLIFQDIFHFDGLSTQERLGLVQTGRWHTVAYITSCLGFKYEAKLHSVESHSSIQGLIFNWLWDRNSDWSKYYRKIHNKAQLYKLSSGMCEKTFSHKGELSSFFFSVKPNDHHQQTALKARTFYFLTGGSLLIGEIKRNAKF